MNAPVKPPLDLDYELADRYGRREGRVFLSGTQALLRLYPPEIRDWIDRHGGLKPEYMELRGKELSALYNACPEEPLGN